MVGTLLAATSGSDQLIAWSTFASVVVVGVAAIFAGIQIALARRIQNEETRPYIYIDVETRNDHLLWMVIHNSGKTMAHNVSFTFDPPLESTIDGGDLRDRGDFMGQTWKMLPPGKKIETIFDATVERFASDLPNHYKVQARYSDSKHNRCYDEPMNVDFGVYLGRAYVETRTFTQLTKAVEGIREELAALGTAPFTVLTKPLEEDEPDQEVPATPGELAEFLEAANTAMGRPTPDDALTAEPPSTADPPEDKSGT